MPRREGKRGDEKEAKKGGDEGAPRPKRLSKFEKFRFDENVGPPPACFYSISNISPLTDKNRAKGHTRAISYTSVSGHIVLTSSYPTIRTRNGLYLLHQNTYINLVGHDDLWPRCRRQ